MKYLFHLLQTVLIVIALIAGVTLAQITAGVGPAPISAVLIDSHYIQLSPPPELKNAQPMVPWFPYGQRGILV